MAEKPSLNFPKRFFWGAATSSHQVEGNTHNQWTVWELENAKSLAHAAEYKLGELPSWDRIRDEATSAENYVSGRAIDHYNQYEKDFDIVKGLNFNAFRFSIEWSRLEPEEGKWDPAEIQHYRDYLLALKKRGIEPFVTLYHWTVPTWFANKGGFENPSNIKYFVRFAEKVLMELGEHMRYITTINEPDTVSSHGYFLQEHPPQSHSWIKGIMVYRNLLAAHKKVYVMGKKMSRRFQIGFTKSYAYAYPGNDERLTKVAVRLDYFFRDDLILWYVGKKNDFIGMNYYFSDRYIGTKIDNSHETRVSDLGWGMHPENIEHVITRLGKRHPKVPIVITESGVADGNDEFRKWWIAHSLQAMQNAIKKGIKLEGYLHWSLLDNFEWAFGRWPRFGLIAVDYKTLKRSPRPSAIWFGALVKKIRGL